MALKWNEDIGSGDSVEAEDFIEIRDNVEKVENEKCSTHYTGDDDSYNGEDWDNEDGTFNSGTESSDYGGHHDSDYGSHNSGYDAGTDESHCSTHYTDDHDSDYDSHDGSYDSDYDGSDLGTYDSSDDGSWCDILN